jgi:hypothetical protein
VGEGKTLKLRPITAAFILLLAILLAFNQDVKGETSIITLYAHSETTTINGATYYMHKPEPSNGPATILSAPADTAGRKLMGRWVYPLNKIASIKPSTWTVTYRIKKSLCASSLKAHADIDILIRKNDNTIKTIIATNVANSPTITKVDTWETLTATYEWPGYTVTDQTDYLEVAYYIEVTAPQSLKNVSLLVDDPSLPITDQTKIENIIISYKNFLTVKTDPEGITTIPGQGWYDENTTVNLTAPDIINISTGVRYKFTQWSVDGVSQGMGVNPINLVMNTNHTATAHYTLQYLLTVQTNPPDLTPQPTRNPSGETGPANGWWYAASTNVTLTAQSVTQYTFQYWNVDNTSQGAGVTTITVVMDAPHKATAHYTQVTTYKLKIETTTGGTTNPTSGTYTYAAGTQVQVTANPSSGYIFDHWELNGTNVGTATTYTVTMNANYILKAFFRQAPPPLTVLISPMTASIFVGQQITFTSTVTGGTTPYTYQWYLNNQPVTGATSNTWTFTPTATGTYYISLKITDASGNTAQSDPARITVSSVPVGGHSIQLVKRTTTSEIAAYTILIALLSAVLSLTKRKWK